METNSVFVSICRLSPFCSPDSTPLFLSMTSAGCHNRHILRANSYAIIFILHISILLRHFGALLSLYPLLLPVPHCLLLSTPVGLTEFEFLFLFCLVYPHPLQWKRRSLRRRPSSSWTRVTRNLALVKLTRRMNSLKVVLQMMALLVC